MVVVTRGASGPWGITAAGEAEFAAPKRGGGGHCGAGDSFMAALLSGVVDRGLGGAQNRADLCGLPAEGLAALLAHATRAAAVTVSRAGANPPTRAELNRVRSGRSSSKGSRSPHHLKGSHDIRRSVCRPAGRSVVRAHQPVLPGRRDPASRAAQRQAPCGRRGRVPATELERRTRRDRKLCRHGLRPRRTRAPAGSGTGPCSTSRRTSPRCRRAREPRPAPSSRPAPFS